MDTSDNSLASDSDGKKRKVAYFYRPDVGLHFYGKDHSMKPLRITMTHELIKNYNLLQKMEFINPPIASDNDLLKFHSYDYVKFLKEITPEKIPKFREEINRFNFNSDCPVFDDLYSYCCAYAAGSIYGAKKLNDRSCDIAINWAGGLHHAKKCGASGFCYVNDIVLAILNLLQEYERVLYLDIDVHHGDGVEEAFYTTNRVMTVSFHKFGHLFFPETGHIDDIGTGTGKYYSLNVPLHDGIDDQSYQYLFKPVMKKVMEVYDPKIVVLQCGADSLAGDSLGCFNLSIKGHGECVKFMRSFNVPMLLLGGGGYTLGNVARCWSYETALAVKEELPDKLPENDYYDFYWPDHKLHVQSSGRMENKNKRREMEKLKDMLLENLGKLQHVPSVQFQDKIDSSTDEMAEVKIEDADEIQDEQMMENRLM